MRIVIATAVGLLALCTVAADAQAKVSRYRSQHPLPRKIAHGFCYIEVPHVHNFEPADRRLYREIDGQFYFVGDPAAFPYEGPRYSFYGAHPVVEANMQGQPLYCYLGGPHYHWYQPPPEARFEFRGGAYWFVGSFDPIFVQDRPRYLVVNDAYRPLVYTRPVVDISVAPPGFQGEVILGSGGWRGRAVAPAPVVSAGVQVVAPAPTVQVGVGINLGGPPPIRVVEHRHVYEVHERHDRGRHRGWAKQARRDDGWRGKPAPSPPSGGWRGNAAPAPASGGWRGKPNKQNDHHSQGGWRR